jgi:hypothetical protein
VLLLNASRRPANFAAVVLAVQAVGALIAFGLAWRRHGGPPPGGAPNVPQTSAAAGNGSSAGREELRDALGRGAEPAEVGGAAER